MNKSMHALVKKTPGQGLTLETVAIPKIDDKGVLIRVLQTAICGTDVHIYRWDNWARTAIDLPRVTGHEFVGEVIACGTAVDGIRAGDIVSGEGHIVCGKCRNCSEGKAHLCPNHDSLGISIDGAFAEYVALPQSNVWKHNASIDLDTATVFDPLGNAVHACQQFAVLGEDVLVSGAGPLGLLTTAVARFAGARSVTVTDVNSRRLQLASELGADNCLPVADRSLAEAVQHLELDGGFGIGIEMSGSARAIADMVGQMRYGGKIAMLGIPIDRVDIDWNKVLFGMVCIQGVSGRRIFETWRLMSVMIESGLDLTRLIQLKLPYTEFQQGFDYLLSGGPGKVILDWS